MNVQPSTGGKVMDGMCNAALEYGMDGEKDTHKQRGRNAVANATHSQNNPEVPRRIDKTRRGRCAFLSQLRHRNPENTNVIFC